MLTHKKVSNAELEQMISDTMSAVSKLRHKIEQMWDVDQPGDGSKIEMPFSGAWQVVTESERYLNLLEMTTGVEPE